MGAKMSLFQITYVHKFVVFVRNFATFSIDKNNYLVSAHTYKIPLIIILMLIYFFLCYCFYAYITFILFYLFVIKVLAFYINIFYVLEQNIYHHEYSLLLLLLTTIIAISMRYLILFLFFKAISINLPFYELYLAYALEPTV